MKLSLIIAVCLVVGFIIVLFATRKAPSPLGKPCSVCKAESRYGYSDHAEEEAAKIKPMCLQHLTSQLEKDYANYRGRAVVIQPAAGPPCYVFQPVKEWRESFKDSKIPDDVLSLLAKIESKCHECGRPANFLYVESSGLTGDSFEDTLNKGISETLLRHNPQPISLCAGRCVKRIGSELDSKRLSYLEVCAPKDNNDGFVIPMGY